MNEITAVRELVAYHVQGQNTIHAVGALSPAGLVSLQESDKPQVRGPTARKWHEPNVLGGGTQIGECSPIARFRRAIAASKSESLFRAGVTPCTEGPVPQWPKEEEGEVLHLRRYLGVRGAESAATVARVGVEAKAMGDPGRWFVKPVDYWQPEDGLVGVNVGHSHGHMYGQESTIQAQLTELVRRLLARGKRIEFFCVWPEDLDTARRIAAAAGIERPVIHEIYEGAARFQASVRRMQLFVGIKLHAVALSMCTGVPSWMVEYRPKCRESATTIGVEDFGVCSDSLDVDKMMALLSTLEADGRATSRVTHDHATIDGDRIRELSRSLLSSQAR